MRRILLAMTFCLAGLAAGPAPAWADDPTFEVTADRTEVRHPEDREVVFRVRIRTGAQAERFELAASSKTSLLSISEMSFEGAGVVLRRSSSHGDPCGFTGTFDMPLFRGAPLHFARYHEVEIPPSTETVFAIRAAVHPHAPRPGTTYALGISASNGFSAGGTLATSRIPIESPALRAVGRLGVKLGLELSVPTTGPGCGPGPFTTAGDAIEFRGTTDPPLDRQRVELWIGRPGRERAYRLRTVLTARDGTFALDGWRPLRPGAYAVQARYRAQAPDRADDFGPPLRFTLVDPEAAAPPGDAPVWPARLARVRGERLELPVRCLSARRLCAGRIWIERRGRVVGTRRFRVARGGSATLAVRLRRGLGSRAVHVTVRSRSDIGRESTRNVRVRAS